MDNLNIITGLPRSGSTLLCNILNQNPKYHASSTSALPLVLSNMSLTMTNSFEVKSDLISDKKTYEKIKECLRAFCNTWYEEYNTEVFDKSRAWMHNILLLRDLYPESKVIVCVRDLRSVFGSIEKQHRKTPIFDASDLNNKTVYNRANEMMSPEGFIGMPVLGVMELLHRKIKNVLFVRMEDLVSKSEQEIKRINEFLGDDFKYDLNNIQNTATDVDGLYNNKFPHKTKKEIYSIPEDEWKEYYHEDLGTLIMERYPAFNREFYYK